jgi:hypothetical protein
MKDKEDNPMVRFTGRVTFALLVAGFVSVAVRAGAADVSSFMLGASNGFYPPAVLHGAYAFNQIQVVFDTDVMVDFYDLHLNAIAPAPYSLPFSGFSYDRATHTAVWRVDGQPSSQNERFLAVLSGVWDYGGVPLTGGGYTNEFSILTGDVSGDGQVSALDPLVIINHLNSGNPYNPALDVNLDGQVSALDTLIVINMINASSGSIPLIPPGAYSAVINDPPAGFRISTISCRDGRVALQFAGLPDGCMSRVRGKGTLSEANWYTVVDFHVTNGLDQVSFPMLPASESEFYRVSFQ